MNRSDRILAKIARDHLLIPTLESRKSDHLDFHDVAVWQVDAALKAAFYAGNRSAGTDSKPRDKSAPDVPPTPLLIPRGTVLLPGRMYLRLYHGRTDPDQDMDDWGFDGPTFGPLCAYVHTYCSNFRIHGAGDTSESWLDRHGDMIRWDECFYGDMEVFIAGDNDRA